MYWLVHMCVQTCVPLRVMEQVHTQNMALFYFVKNEGEQRIAYISWLFLYESSEYLFLKQFRAQCLWIFVLLVSFTYKHSDDVVSEFLLI